MNTLASTKNIIFFTFLALFLNTQKLSAGKNKKTANSKHTNSKDEAIKKKNFEQALKCLIKGKKEINIPRIKAQEVESLFNDPTELNKGYNFGWAEFLLKDNLQLSPEVCEKFITTQKESLNREVQDLQGKIKEWYFDSTFAVLEKNSGTEVFNVRKNELERLLKEPQNLNNSINLMWAQCLVNKETGISPEVFQKFINEDSSKWTQEAKEFQQSIKKIYSDGYVTLTTNTSDELKKEESFSGKNEKLESTEDPEQNEVQTALPQGDDATNSQPTVEQNGRLQEIELGNDSSKLKFETGQESRTTNIANHLNINYSSLDEKDSSPAKMLLQAIKRKEAADLAKSEQLSKEAKLRIERAKLSFELMSHSSHRSLQYHEHFRRLLKEKNEKLNEFLNLILQGNANKVQEWLNKNPLDKLAKSVNKLKELMEQLIFVLLALSFEDENQSIVWDNLILEIFSKNISPHFQHKKNGLTPLHVAVASNRKKMINFLLKQGVPNNVQDAQGKYAFEYAHDEHTYTALKNLPVISEEDWKQRNPHYYPSLLQQLKKEARYFTRMYCLRNIVTS